MNHPIGDSGCKRLLRKLQTFFPLTLNGFVFERTTKISAFLRRLLNFRQNLRMFESAMVQTESTMVLACSAVFERMELQTLPNSCV